MEKFKVTYIDKCKDRRLHEVSFGSVVVIGGENHIVMQHYVQGVKSQLFNCENKCMVAVDTTTMVGITSLHMAGINISERDDID